MGLDPYPKIGARPWAQIRAKVATTPSWKVTPESVSASLAMKGADSARQNIVGPLKRLGLINDDGSLSERGLKWRTEDGYAEACDEILTELYPDTLLHLTDDQGRADKAAVRRWFDQKGYGASAASQMTATFVMIAAREIPEVPPPSSGVDGAVKKKAKSVRSTAALAKSDGAKSNDGATSALAPPADALSSNGPSVHLDIQIHIPPDSSPEQLDAIFASMAKHLYRQ